MSQIARLRAIPAYQFWYMATPYSKYEDGIEAAARDAAKGAARLVMEGVKVFSPITHFHTIAIHGGLDPMDHKIWMPAEEPFIHLAWGLIVYKLPGWEESYGIECEISSFRQWARPVEFLIHPMPHHYD